MIICHDSEFLDDGKTIELISIAMVAEDGSELYLVNEQAPWNRLINHPWLRDNVLPHLPHIIDAGMEPPHNYIARLNDPVMATRNWIAAHVQEFLESRGGPDDVQLWADYPATDHVALYQLFGPMVDCTKHGVPMRTSCLTQEEEAQRRMVRLDPRLDVPIARPCHPRPTQDPDTVHHALHDARHDMDLARWLGLVD